jgi:hypothetical protein
MARRRRRRRPGGHTTAVGSGGRRDPFSTDTAAHTHTARSLACPLLTLSSAHPFSTGIFRSNGAPASLPPASFSLTHARRMDGFCNQNADQLGSLAGPSLLTVYVGVVECAPASLPPASFSLTHARRMDRFCNQNADQLGSLAGPSLLTVYVGVVECSPASPYTYSSSTHRFPDERTPIEATPLSATSAELGLGLGQGLGLDSLSHSSWYALPFFSPPSFHTLAFSPAFTSVWWSASTILLPPRAQFCIRYCSNKHNTTTTAFYHSPLLQKPLFIKPFPPFNYL